MKDDLTQVQRDNLLSEFLLEQSETSGDHFMQAAHRLKQCAKTIEKFNAVLSQLGPAAEDAINAFSLHGLGDLDEAIKLHQAYESTFQPEDL